VAIKAAPAKLSATAARRKLRNWLVMTEPPVLPICQQNSSGGSKSGGTF
jgi:hypothetical protein